MGDVRGGRAGGRAWEGLRALSREGAQESQKASPEPARGRAVVRGLMSSACVCQAARKEVGGGGGGRRGRAGVWRSLYPKVFKISLKNSSVRPWDCWFL